MQATGNANRLTFYVGLGLLTAGTLMLQIIETRIVSVTSWYHLAFFVISIAMFGLTAGAVWVYLRPNVYTRETLSYHLCIAALAFALATTGALLFQLTIVTSLPASVMSFVVWAEFAVALSLPFFFSGIAVSLALTRSPYPVGIVYGIDLLGAAVGCLAALVLMNLVNGPSAVLWTACLAAGGALLFARSGLGVTPERTGIGAWIFARRHWIFAGLIFIAAANSLTEGIRPTIVKNTFDRPGNFAYEKWNSFSRVTIGHDDTTPPSLWGPSPLYVPENIQQRWMSIDGAVGTAVYNFTGDFDQLDFLRFDVTNLAYSIPDREKSAVIGVGGGRDVLSALKFGATTVNGVEINPILVDLLKNRYADYNTVASLPGVDLQVDEARSWFARTDLEFDIIQMSLIDTWAATGAGAYTLSENGLYTVEAWRVFLERLTDDGVFSVSRWYAPGEVNESGRMVSLAVATLHDLGVGDPRRHLFVGASGNIATLILSRSPFTDEALAALRATMDEYDFTTLIDPDATPASPLLDAIVSAPDNAALAAAVADSYLDLTPPYDARPFFFNQLRLDRLAGQKILTEVWRPGVYGGNLSATITLALLIVISALLVVVTIILPLRSTVARVAPSLALAGTGYFALIGVGFMMTEIALLQRISVFLGHPVYALSIVLFSLILSTGIGSLVSERTPLSTAAKLMGWAILTAAYLFLLPAWLPSALIALESSGLPVRAGLAVLVLFPAGFLMGFGFPTGMRLVQAIDERPTPWFWGINGAAGVLAASVAVLTSIETGIDTTMRVGAICYLLLAWPALILLRTPAKAASGRKSVGRKPAAAR